MLSESLVFRLLVKENEDSGNEIGLLQALKHTCAVDTRSLTHELRKPGPGGAHLYLYEKKVDQRNHEKIANKRFSTSACAPGRTARIQSLAQVKTLQIRTPFLFARVKCKKATEHVLRNPLPHVAIN